MKYLLLLFFLFSTSTLFSQSNLVPNPSFEVYSTCPDNWGQIYKADFWSAYCNSPDYFNKCNIDSYSFSVPNNRYGNKNPLYPNDGAYAGFGISFSNYREIIGVKILDSLRIGSKYFISFDVAPTLSSISHCFYNKIGVKFMTFLYSSGYNLIDNTCSIYEDSLYSDTLSWQHLSWAFVADSSYNYLAIGCFFVDSLITSSCLQPDWGLYLVDNVCVSLDSLECIERINNISVINASNISVKYFLDGFSLENILYNSELKVFNVIGKLLFKSIINSSDKISTSAWANGIYLIKIDNKTFKYFKN